MSKFARLDNLKVLGGATATFDLPELGEEAALTLAPATEANKPLLNATLKHSKSTGRSRKGQSASLIKENRNVDRNLYAKFVVKDWVNIKDDKGVPVDFNEEEVLGLLKALPDDLFDEIRMFAGDLASFRADIQVDDIAGN
jgi:hypothetical protein